MCNALARTVYQVANELGKQELRRKLARKFMQVSSGPCATGLVLTVMQCEVPTSYRPLGRRN
jgi:hypothetical protein